MNNVYPVAITGDINTGLLPESLKTFLSKYNIHQHVHINPNSFLATGIRVGDTVNSAFFIDIFNRSYLLFDEDNEVVEINEDKLIVNKAANVGVNDFLLFVQQADNDFYVSSCRIEEGSSEIYLNKNVGFISSSQLEPLTLETYPFILSNVINNVTYPIIIRSLKKFYVHSLDIKILSGTNTNAFINYRILNSSGTQIFTSSNYNLLNGNIFLATQTNVQRSFIDIGEQLGVAFTNVMSSLTVALNVNIVTVCPNETTHYQAT